MASSAARPLEPAPAPRLRHLGTRRRRVRRAGTSVLAVAAVGALVVAGTTLLPARHPAIPAGRSGDRTVTAALLDPSLLPQVASGAMPAWQKVPPTDDAQLRRCLPVSAGAVQ